MRALRVLLMVALALVAARQASALAIEDYQFQVQVGGEVVQDGLYGLPITRTYDPASHTWGYILSGPLALDGATINTWSSVYDVDPFVTNNINLTNTSGVSQTYIITAALPVPAFAYDRAVFSSVGITATDS